MNETMINCPHCTETWTVRSGPDGRGYLRKDLVEAAPSLAAHMRDVHDDEETAIRYERYAVTPPKWLPEI